MRTLNGSPIFTFHTDEPAKEENVSTEERKLRHAVVGMGAGIFRSHSMGLGLDDVEVVGGSDVAPEPGQERAEEWGCPFFPDHRQMLAETRPEVTVVITPHPFHAPIAIDALNAGSHVLVEKPIATQVKDADAMIAAARANGRVLAVNYQYRQLPHVRAMKRLIDGGQLGRIQRVTGVFPWMRTAAYYRRGGWRGTWKGEGGGVLMNQAPHDLDLLCHLVGMPLKVYAATCTRLHAIQTEDTATALLEWPEHAQGTIYFSTTESGPRWLEVSGTGGKIVMHADRIEYERYETDLRQLITGSEAAFVRPQPEAADAGIEDEPEMHGHEAVYRDFHRAVREGGEPRCNGEEGLKSLELANAMIYSGATGKAVSLPLDREAYSDLLARLQGEE